MKRYVKPSFNCSDDEAKPKPQHGDPSVNNQGRGHSAFKKRPFPHPQQSPLQARVNDSFIPLKLSIQDIFEAIKSQPWVKRFEEQSNMTLFVPERRTIALP